MCSFFVVLHVHDIFEPKLASFHKYLSMEMMNKTECVLRICNAKCYNFLMSSKIYNILRWYHILVHFDIQRKML